MSITVLLEFHARPDTAQDLTDLLEKILPDTRAATGFEDLRLSRDQDNPTRVVSHETWTDREAFSTYLQWRVETRVIDQVGALLAAPPSITYLDILQ